jgi:diguanylate cyclase (GGDEF)-like protein
MESASKLAGTPSPIDRSLLGSAARSAAEMTLAEPDPAKAIAAGIEALHETLRGTFPSVFVLDHARLWLVWQRGYAVVPDGIQIARGVMGRAVRLGRGQIVHDVSTDPDYVRGLPGVTAELAIPLKSGAVPVGVLNLESERPLSDDALELLEPLAAVLAPRVEALGSESGFDLAALARLFVYLGSMRDASDIAELAAVSLARVLPLDVTQLWVWDESGTAVEHGSWLREGTSLEPLASEELSAVRTRVDPSAVCQLLEGVASGRHGDLLVWLPLRANAEEIGALVGAALGRDAVDPGRLDSAAVLAAHVAASLEGVLALHQERRSAETDSLTGILNRRGLEQRLHRALEDAQARRVPLSLLVFDCDDFKDVNDRAGHEFGDALLREVGEVLARSVPIGADVARLGGDEFVVMLPGADPDAAEALGVEVRRLLAAGLTDAGFPLRLSAGISTYPFDGAGASTLLRSADQALYAAKTNGKDRVASFRQVVRHENRALDPAPDARDEPSGRPGRRDASVLADAIAAAKAIDAETSVEGVLARLCKSLVFVVGATACSVSRVVDGYLVDATEHALRQVWLGDEAAYRISDFPLTEDALRTGEPRAVSFLDDMDPAEAFILRELDMNAMLMIPLHVSGESWGLVELYEMRLRRFTEDDVSIAQFLTTQATRRLEVVGSAEGPPRRPPVYKFPPGSGEGGRPRAR